jgi:hypothetical protein
MRGHLNINLEKTSELLKRKLTAEVIDEFGAVNIVGSSSQTASVLITASGHAYGIREDLVRADISHAFLHVDDDTESDRNLDSESDGEDSDVSSRGRIAARVGRERRLDADRDEGDDTGTDSVVADEDEFHNEDSDADIQHVNMLRVDGSVVDDEEMDVIFDEDVAVNVHDVRDKCESKVVLLWDTGAAKHLFEFIPEGGVNVRRSSRYCSER